MCKRHKIVNAVLKTTELEDLSFQTAEFTINLTNLTANSTRYSQRDRKISRQTKQWSEADLRIHGH